MRSQRGNMSSANAVLAERPPHVDLTGVRPEETIISLTIGGWCRYVGSALFGEFNGLAATGNTFPTGPEDGFSSGRIAQSNAHGPVR